MSVLGSVFVIGSELWPQRDARDPLGVFGWRVTQASDASGGSNKIVVKVEEDQRHAYVYKIYDMLIVQVAGTVIAAVSKMRILTNWPNIDVQAGIQAYGAIFLGGLTGSGSLTAPNSAFSGLNPFSGNSKELLIYDPSTTNGDMDIAEQEVVNSDNVTFSFEGYGYYWDRAVMQTPGGPRNPGTT